MKIRNTELLFVNGKGLDQEGDALVLSLLSNCQLQQNLLEEIGEQDAQKLVEVLVKRLSISPQEAIYIILDHFKTKSILGVICDFQGVAKPENYLRECYTKLFDRVNQQKLKSIVLPDLGATQNLFPERGAAKIMAQEIFRYLRNNEHALEKIIVCIEDKDVFDCFNQTVLGYLAHMEDDMGEGPYVTVDAIIEMMDGVILIERSNPPYGWALPGGFVDVGESLEDAVIREVKEETALEMADLKQFHIYSDPNRDPRFHTVSTVFVGTGKGSPKAGDDAQAIKTIPYEDLLNHVYAFDHLQIITDYLDRRWG